MGDTIRQVIHSAGIAHCDGVQSPASLVFEDAHLIDIGMPEEIGGVGEGTRVVDARDMFLLPPLVNAHCHLDLTAIGCQPYGGNFIEWIEMVRSRRPVEPDAIAASMRAGIALARAGGTGLIGDIAGGLSTVPMDIQREQGMPGVSFREFFGIGHSEGAGLEAMQRIIEQQESTPGTEAAGVRIGLQPHAPYSCAPELYRLAGQSGLPVATHLAETPEELLFTQQGDGPFADMLRRFKIWDDRISGPAGRAVGEHPLEALAEVLADQPWVVAHLNYVNAEQIARIARWPVSIAYCPRTSAYFGHPRDREPGQPMHRYQDMMDAGINVALGTDSIICLDTSDRISILDEMRVLHRRDACDPFRVIAMATVNGARALSFDPSIVSFNPGLKLGVIGIPVDAHSTLRSASSQESGMALMKQILESDALPRWIVGPFSVHATAQASRSVRAAHIP